MSDCHLDNYFCQLRSITCNQLDLKSLSHVLQNLTLSMKSSQNRELLGPSHWSEIAILSKIGSQILSKNEYVTEELEFVAEMFRFLRNSCGGSTVNQFFILNTADVFDFAKKPLSCLLQKETSEEIAILKICIQLFGNILLCNDSCKPLVWREFFHDNIFKFLLCSKNLVVQEYTAMVLYNSMSEENCNCILHTKEGHDIIISVINTLLNNSLDWGMLFIEYLLKQKDFLSSCYSNLPLENRLLILDIIIEHLKCAENDESALIPIASINYLKTLFLNSVREIAGLCNISNTTLEPAEIVKLLSLLCSASVCNSYVSFIISNKDLLEKSIETLKCIHLLGKKDGNIFSCAGTQINSLFNKQMVCHPLFGFKKDLVRLIGNLCYGCRENQDLVRELDGIPLVLDCCKLDAKNPYITQWCILAIRNILENNKENQAVLAGITTNGEVVDSSVLKELGIQVHVVDGKLTLK